MDYKAYKELLEKYDKALQAVKVLQDTYPTVNGIQDWVKNNFPELKESEDERIRKDIICILANTNLSSVDTTFADMVTWLKKQKPVELSKEDMGIVKDIIYFVSLQKYENRSDDEYQRAEKCLAWLNNLYLMCKINKENT